MLSRDDTGIQAVDSSRNKCNCCPLLIGTSSKDAQLAFIGKDRSTTCLKFTWFLVGIGFLFPYNSVVTAVDFFASIYFKSIDFALGWLLLLPSMLILITTLRFGYWGTIYQRIIGTFLLQAILTVIIPLVRNVYVVFLSTFILGCLSAILQGTLFSLLGFLGPDMMGITQTGVGCSGVLVGIVRIVTKVWIPTDIRDSTYLYFLMAFIMVIICIMLYIFVLHPEKRVQKAIHEDSMKNKSLHAIKVAAKASNSNIKINANTTTKKTMSHNEFSSIISESKKKGNNYQAISSEPSSAAPSIVSGSGDDKKDNGDSISNRVHVIEDTESNGSVKEGVDKDKSDEEEQIPLSLPQLFLASWRCQIAVFLNYTLTLSLFPGVMSLMKFSDDDDAWFAVIQIFLFNLFDTFGKNATTYKWMRDLWSHNGLLIASILRLGFIPLFVMCVKPQIFTWQIAIIINALMGISNGFVGTSGFCLGPEGENVPKHEKGRTAQMLAVSLTSGLVCGSSSAFLINYVMENYL